MFAYTIWVYLTYTLKFISFIGSQAPSVIYQISLMALRSSCLVIRLKALFGVETNVHVGVL